MGFTFCEKYDTMRTALFMGVHGMSIDIQAVPGGAIITGIGGEWKPNAEFRCRVIGRNGEIGYFDEAECVSKSYKTGVGSGVSCVYSNFAQFPGLEIETRVWVEDTTGDVRYELIPRKDALIKAVLWPAPFEHDDPEGYTVLPVMQGCLVKNHDPRGVHMRGAYEPSTRGMTMRFFAQYDRRGGYVMLVDDGFDCGMEVSAEAGECVQVSPKQVAIMGYVGHERTLRLKMMPAGADYNDAAAIYRAYLQEKGELMTLKEKIARNPMVAEYVGMPVCHTDAYIHIVPESSYYRPDEPEFNDRLVTFDQVGEKLRRLHDLGVEKLCLHLDGWHRRGYDNLHPDALPPCEAAGGWEGFARLRKTCHELGYKFGIHDQYRDYYFDCDSFDWENAAVQLDGSYGIHSAWYGGKQTMMCGKLSMDYVRRNYDEMERHDARPDNAYLDVFSVVDLDECHNPAHKMTREECAAARGRCFANVRNRGIVIQSEEIVDWAASYIDFIHHAPYALDQAWDKGEPFGQAIPLQFLVYHDCVIMPYFAQHGGFGVPMSMDGALMSLLYGCGTYISAEADKNDVERMETILAWQKKVQMRPMVKHQFLGGRRERCEFEGGYACEVDFASGEYQLIEG